LQFPEFAWQMLPSMALRVLPAVEKLARYAMNRRGMTSRWVDAAGIRLHVYEGKSAGKLPPMVFLHGLGSAGAAFAGVARRIRPEVSRLVVPELPGHGFSARGDNPVTPEILLDAVDAALANVLETHEPAIIYGNSLGGALAIKYALRRPAQVRALVLVSPAGALLPDDEWRDLVATFRVTGRRDARRFLDRLYHRPPWFLGLLAHEFPELLAKPAVREILASATQEHAPTPAELASLAMPILFLWGQSEKLLPPSALRYFRAHLPPHAIVEEPHGFGHTPQLEEPARLAARILAFARDTAKDTAR
jgi:pimeloyl-ACP methyl ester carboxylesterase